ncbi:MAG: hypothetical protein KJZ83_00240 [Burkholderiaceae bacterium]|nr:hypothetical protein [Burkholderiaceae bacterium]
MKLEKIVECLKLLGTQNIQAHKRTGWVISRCPLEHWRHENGHSGPEVFGVRIEAGDPAVNCFACGWHGTLGSLIIAMRHMNKQACHVDAKWGQALELVDEAEKAIEFDFDSPGIEEMLFGPKEGRHYFPEWWLDSFPVWHEIGWAVDYLAERKVPAAVANALDLHADTKEKRVCFPVRDFNERLVGLHGRAIQSGVDPRYRMYTQAGKNNPLYWLGESWVDLTKPILVVEGPFDLASAYRVYRNVVSPLFSNPSFEKLRRMADALEWITFLDRGKGGDAGRSKVDKFLQEDHVIHHLQPPKGRKDPGVCSPEEIAELLSGIVKLDDLLLD